MNINPVGNFNFNAYNLQQQINIEQLPAAPNPVMNQHKLLAAGGNMVENKYDANGNLLPGHRELTAEERQAKLADFGQDLDVLREESDVLDEDKAKILQQTVKFTKFADDELSDI